MAGRPFRFATLIDPTSNGPLGLAELAAQHQADTTVPAHVVDAWDNYRKTLGYTVPYNVTRQKLTNEQLVRLVR